MKKLIFSLLLLFAVLFTNAQAKQILTLPGINSKVQVTSTSSELNIVDGALITTPELNRLVGARDNIQTQIDAKLDTVNKEALTNNVYLKSEIDAMIYTPYTGGIIETKARLANQERATTGVTRAVPGTYATLTAAYTAANDGDIILVAAGTYLTSAESGGYWLVNTNTKGVIVRGATGNPNDVIIRHTSAATYGIRLRDCLGMQFENLTFEDQGTFAPFIMEQAYACNWVKFKNCKFKQTSGGAAGIFGRTSLTSDTDVIWIEFDQCTIESNGTIAPIQYTASGVNETLLITNTTIITTGLTGVACTHQYDSGHKGVFAMYDCTLTSSNNNIILRVGDDEAVPTNTTFKVDVRNNIFSYTGSFANHGVLLGRGSNKVYFVNNTITIPSSSNSLAIGIVLKTTATAVNDAYIAGNYSVAPRPYYFKGGQNLITKYNTFITNYPTTYFGLEVANPDAGRISTGNVVRFNNIFGGLAAIGTYDSASWEDPETTIKGWDINYNRYYSTLGVSNYMNISSVNKAFSTAKVIFNNYNDKYSQFISTNSVSQNPIKIYDNTSTISW